VMNQVFQVPAPGSTWACNCIATSRTVTKMV